MTTVAQPAPARPDVPPGAAPGGTRGLVAVIAAGLFATGLGWPGLIGRLPFNQLLKNQLQLPAHYVDAFWGVATFAFGLKPLVGLVADAYPLLGTRRRGYLIAGGAASAVLWMAFAVVPRAYLPLLVVMTALNLALVFVSTVVGGILVEVGQRHGATGRLSSLRMGLTGAMSLAAGPLGAWLAGQDFRLTAATGALILLGFVPVAALLYREPRGARPDRAVFHAARQHLERVYRSPGMWAAAGLIFLVYTAPGLHTALFYHQQDRLGFDLGFIGALQLLGGAGGLVGAGVYAVLCRRLPLRALLVAGIALNVASTLFFLGYTSRATALLITPAAGVLYALAILPLYDLAARATPAGGESFGYGLLMGIQTLTTYLLSNPLGSYLYGHFHVGFGSLVWINAWWTAAALIFVPALPRLLLASADRRR